MSNDPVFMRAGELLLEHLRSELVPVVISSGDMLKIAHPGMEEDFRLGLYLHDLEEVRPNGPPGMTRLGEDTRRFPDLLLALHFLAYANRKVAFNSMGSEDELLLLEAVYRAVHGVGKLELDGRELRLDFHPLTRAEKLSLWQSLNEPLQPAVYLTIEPILVPSTRISRVPPVREVQTSAKYMEKGGRNH